MSTQRHSLVPTRSFPGQDLTSRELEILHLAGMGLSMKSVARSLGITSGTVKWHVSNLYQKLGAGSREEALHKARARNLIDSRLVCPHCACSLAVNESRSSGFSLLRQ